MMMYRDLEEREKTDLFLICLLHLFLTFLCDPFTTGITGFKMHTRGDVIMVSDGWKTLSNSHLAS